jgi:uncharacterized protein (TIGR00255 family)
MRSMTGYGRGTATFEGRQIAVELSAVNRKQAEIALSLPKGLLELEPRVRDEINAHISRGRLTVVVALHVKGGGKHGSGGGINIAAAKAYRTQLEGLRKSLKRLRWTRCCADPGCSRRRASNWMPRRRGRRCRRR